jgi:hypothetical protein
MDRLGMTMPGEFPLEGIPHPDLHSFDRQETGRYNDHHQYTAMRLRRGGSGVQKATESDPWSARYYERDTGTVRIRPPVGSIVGSYAVRRLLADSVKGSTGR